MGTVDMGRDQDRTSADLCSRASGAVRFATVVIAVLLGGCASPTASSGPSATSSAPSTTAATLSPPTARPSVVPPTTANPALADFVRQTGRSDLRICLYVDPATAADPAQML